MCQSYCSVESKWNILRGGKQLPASCDCFAEVHKLTGKPEQITNGDLRLGCSPFLQSTVWLSQDDLAQTASSPQMPDGAACQS